MRGELELCAGRHPCVTANAFVVAALFVGTLVQCGITEPIELGSIGSTIPLSDEQIAERGEKLKVKIGRTKIEYTDDLENGHVVTKATSLTKELGLKKDAKNTVDTLKGIMKESVIPKRVKAMTELENDAVNKRRTQWVDAKAAQRRARKELKKATHGVIVAQYKMAEIQAKNEVTRSSFKNVTLAAELKDATACAPYPACLQEKRENGECGDSYPAVACIKARRGNINLCEISTTIQENCCGICLLNNTALCLKERLMLAGYGENPSNTTLTAATLHTFDVECSEIAHQDLANHAASQPDSLSPAYNELVSQEYQRRQAAGGPGPTSLLGDTGSPTPIEAITPVTDDMTQLTELI